MFFGLANLNLLLSHKIKTEDMRCNKAPLLVCGGVRGLDFPETWTIICALVWTFPPSILNQ